MPKLGGSARIALIFGAPGMMMSTTVRRELAGLSALAEHSVLSGASSGDTKSLRDRGGVDAARNTKFAEDVRHVHARSLL
jgi:hypothetical protein